MKAADTVWVAAALIQRERGPDADMSVKEIVERAAELNGASKATLRTMASQHLVATAKPNPDRFRMLTSVGYGRRRLFRQGDPYDPEREGGPTHPLPEDLVADFRPLIGWYQRVAEPDADAAEDAFVSLVRFARESGIWKGVNADEYVARLRADWE